MKVYYEAYGCTLNTSETEMYADYLKENDEIVNTPEKADVIVLGTCIVIQQTEHRMLRRIKELSKFKKRIVVMGCLPVVKKSLINEFSDIEIIKLGK